MEFSDYSDLLKGVSRSFYLSMRVLPESMRLPIGLGYLLARATDTLADTGDVRAEIRLEALGAFRERNLTLIGDLYEKHYCKKIKDECERRLILSLGDVFGYLDGLEEVLRREVQNVVNTILAGQIEDIERFEIEGRSVQSEEELVHYCYQVAGCVGEFWTRVGFQTHPNFSNISQPILEKMGMEFGIGLQLVNIMRDRPADLKQGRDYLPSDITLGQLQKSVWMERAIGAMYIGIDYADSLAKKSSQLAVFMPATLGLETLEKLSIASEDQWMQGVKVSRATVYRELLAGLLR